MKYVGLDVETANYSRDSICSIGLVKCIDEEIVETFYTTINPEDFFAPFNVHLHGIDESDVEDSPTFPEILPKIIDFIGDFPVVAHYAQFDMGAIKDACIKYDIDVPSINYVCTYQLSRATYPNLINYKLNTLSDIILGTNLQDHHHALVDATTTVTLLTTMIKNSQTKSLKDYADKFNYAKFGVLGERGFKKKKTTSGSKIDISSLDYSDENIDPDHIFFEKKFVFTGKLTSMLRKEAMEKVLSIGGVPQNGITVETNYLVMGEQDLRVLNETGKSNKLRKVEKLIEEGYDIQVITENEFIKLLH